MDASGTVAAMAVSAKPIGTIDVDSDHPDALILRTWNKRQEAIATIETRGRMFDADDHSRAELHIYDTLDNGIPELSAATPLGMLPKLWIAMHAAGGVICNEEMRAQSDAIRRADYAEVLTFERELDWAERVIFHLIGDVLKASGGGEA